MRRDVGGHADGDAGRAVHQQVREAGGQHDRLLQALVVVGLPVHGILLQALEQLHGRLGQTRLGVTHGGGGVAVDGTEVAMAVHQRHAHVERLSQANHRVVHCRVAVRVVLADNVADRTGRLHVRAGRQRASFVHRVQDAAVHRLQAVAHIRQGARDDNAHGILQEALLHLPAEFGVQDGGSAKVQVASSLRGLLLLFFDFFVFCHGILLRSPGSGRRWRAW